MLIISLFGWWYGSGWGWLLGSVAKRLKNIQETFSVTILLRTLFSPWKQITTPSTFRNFFQAMIDNLVSRFIGATVRLGMLIAAFFLTISVLLLGMVFFIAWPLVPLLLVILPLLTLTGTELW